MFKAQTELQKYHPPIDQLLQEHEYDQLAI